MNFKDERLAIQNLRNIRIAFVFQTLCIVGILIYDGICNGIMQVTNNPLWTVFIGTLVVFSYLNMRITIDVYQSYHNKKPGSFYNYFFLSLLIGGIFGGVTFIAPEGTTKDALILGGVLFFCFLLTFTVAYFLRKKQYEDNLDEE